MALIVNTNLASLNAQRNLQQSADTLGVSLQRLSSGLRINSAKDDAAGLAIAQGFTTQIRGNSQAIRNANDGISLAQTGEGALAQIGGNLQRIREIAVQAANGSIGDTNRSQLQKEVDQLTQEISRIVQTTQFNGTLLFASSSTLTLQVGANGTANNQIQVSATDLTAATGGGSPTEQAAAQSIADQIALGPDAYNGMVNALFAVAGYPGISYTSNLVTLTSISDDFASSTPESAAALAVWNAAKALYNGGGGQTGGVTLGQVNAAAQGVTDSYAPSAQTLSSYNSSLTATNTIDVTSQSAAVTAIGALDADISKILDVRATYGAVQNRLDAVVANLNNYVENISAARSRIMDADFASETAELTRSQILQQAGTSILAQANALPQTALALLK